MVTTRKRVKAASLSASYHAKALNTASGGATALSEDTWDRVFGCLPGHYLILARVCCAWRARCERLADPHISAQRTVYSAVTSVQLAEWALALGRSDDSARDRESWRLLHRQLTDHALRRGDLPTLKRLHALRRLTDVRLAACSLAAESGRLDVLRWVRGIGCPWSGDFYPAAARGGNVHVLAYAHENGCPLLESRSLCTTGDRAAAGGHLDVLRWLQDHGCALTAGAMSQAAGGGHMNAMRWLPEQGHYLMRWTLADAAGGGHLDMVQWLRQEGCPWDEEACSSAARGGHLNVLRWLRQEPQGCPWGANTCAAAAECGSLKMLQWLREEGCPWNALACAKAASGGHLSVLQWLRESGCPWDQRVLHWTCWRHRQLIDNQRYAIKRVAIADWALANGCPCDEAAMVAYRRWRRVAYGKGA
eukprot:TRINITY_DN2925_c0_g1_i1.p1 TRINITY_DN2925_c0_g1~~TRINITY_DN2925_c0_g1_i1.p1  ORF type:complete len:420 (+),score=73.24 TRINITY_DN2925_c0_g1_i1:195-1454(+)